MARDLGPILDAAYPQVVATLIRVLGDIDRAMDATQDALVKALQSWGVEGVPDNPVAWLVTVGRNRAIDQIRRDQRSQSLDVAEAAHRGNSNVVQLVTEPASPELDEFHDWHEVDDDMLRLLFTCCHPTLPPNAQMVLMLKVVLGFSTEEIARGLLASPASVEKRLTRAKQALKRAEIPYEVPSKAEVPARLGAVLQAIYLIFNEGYTRIQDAAINRGSFIDIAIRLGRITSRLFRHDPQPRSLLALMLLSAARLPGRVDAEGVFVPLPEQDRGLWHQGMVAEGVALIDAVYAARHLPGAYQIQAAISAIHSQAESSAVTDWHQIASLYAKLRDYDPSPVILVNQAVALCYSDQLEEATVLMEAASQVKQLQDYQPYYVALALLAEKSHDLAQALDALRGAVARADSSAQRVYLQRKINALEQLL